MRILRILPHSVGLIACLGGAALAADPVHVRGTVQAVDGSRITIAGNDGKTVALTLGDGWTVGGVAPASMADIKPGSFIGTANMAEGDANEALEVVVFPEALRGTGEGDRGWDLKPNSAMTNATVAEKVDGVSGPTVTLRYKGGEKKVSIPPETPIVTIVAAAASDVKPGVKVFAAGPLSSDGTTLTGGRLMVGKNGVTPPM
ncbi:hypothetical protein P7D22_17975 [Lichenihabitans sp. Uapishka_5]|uniref:hypothetical protein n=1 Tax=Lichenihabitans sp. Uapishka_5 TaxID=3037302 RepID=UPI0029E7FDC3|nr:hypothetical protein [Lichenihabitans sp. Uapishka_5]MDX7953053.1 hypothetical protein [Lichenihabitans sp. Uapishka_5]